MGRRAAPRGKQDWQLEPHSIRVKFSETVLSNYSSAGFTGCVLILVLPTEEAWFDQ